MKAKWFLGVILCWVLVVCGFVLLMRHIRTHESINEAEPEFMLYFFGIFLPCTFCCTGAIWFCTSRERRRLMRHALKKMSESFVEDP